MSPPNRQVTIPKFVGMKAAGQKITMLTAYDYTMASLLDSTGIEGILVGDSLGTAVQGHPNTLPVTLDEMIYHAEMVGRAVKHAMVVFDMPFMSYQTGTHKAVENAGRALKQTRCQAVKLEGDGYQVEVTEALVAAGIPVMAHHGLRPQSVHQLGGYRVQRDRQKLLADAKTSQEAGAFAILLECVPAELAAEITASLSVPTIGIGAGAGCDGQILVTPDLLGMLPGRAPRHAKKYADLERISLEAVGRYRDEVRDGSFPTKEQSFD